MTRQWKDSGVRGLGLVPEHWATGTLQQFTGFDTGWTPPTANPANYEGEVAWANISDLGPKWLDDPARTIAPDAEGIHRQRMVECGELLFSFKLSVGAVSFASMPMHTNEAIARFKDGPALRVRYAYYALPVMVVRNCAYNIYGAPLLNQSLIRQAPVAIPNEVEQLKIADFLDRETAQIDAMIEANEALISLLRCRVDSLIHDTLAGGPSHARIPLKRAVRYQEGPGIMAVDFREEGVPLLRVSCVKGPTVTLDGCNYLDSGKVLTTWSQFRVRRGDLLISASASMGTISEVATDEVEGAVPYTGLIRVMPSAMTKGYAKWFFRSPDFMRQVRELRTGSTIQHFGPTHLDQMSVALPAPAEQAQQVALLDCEVGRIEQVVSEASETTSLLRERRDALITAAVTGRIDPTTGTERVEEAS